MGGYEQVSIESSGCKQARQLNSTSQQDSECLQSANFWQRAVRIPLDETRGCCKTLLEHAARDYTEVSLTFMLVPISSSVSDNVEYSDMRESARCT